jgi:hypothetical protein
LGFRQDDSEEARVRAAEDALAYTHAKGVQVHGLATTGYRMLRRVPFDTVDSTSWIMAAAMGKILYLTDSGDLTTLAISSQSPQRQEDRAHYRTVPPQEQRWIEARIADVGLTVAQVESDLSYRILMCAHQLREWLRSYKSPSLNMIEKGLF